PVPPRLPPLSLPAALPILAEPTSISVNTFGTGKIDDSRLIGLIREHFDLRPYAITKMLDLLHPMYRPTAAYGHFGRNPFEMTYEDRKSTRLNSSHVKISYA